MIWFILPIAKLSRHSHSFCSRHIYTSLIHPRMKSAVPLYQITVSPRRMPKVKDTPKCNFRKREEVLRRFERRPKAKRISPLPSSSTTTTLQPASVSSIKLVAIARSICASSQMTSWLTPQTARSSIEEIIQTAKYLEGKLGSQEDINQLQATLLAYTSLLEHNLQPEDVFRNLFKRK